VEEVVLAGALVGLEQALLESLAVGVVAVLGQAGLGVVAADVAGALKVDRVLAVGVVVEQAAGIGKILPPVEVALQRRGLVRRGHERVAPVEIGVLGYGLSRHRGRLVLQVLLRGRAVRRLLAVLTAILRRRYLRPGTDHIAAALVELLAERPFGTTQQ